MTMTPNPNLRISERRAARKSYAALQDWARRLDEPSGSVVADPPFASREARGGHRCPVPGCRRAMLRDGRGCAVHWWAAQPNPWKVPRGNWAVFDADGKQVWGPGSRDASWWAARGMFDEANWKCRLGIGPAPRPYSIGELPAQTETGSLER